ncbi:MAG: hypothetical protein I3273_06695 [Candidatus Moeniiplasma glomeromycotorum]|nr:hypothetical protein [Candidatus Moeniiplasma glomeromycotorum]MCE8169773.1 hypothetical protein [Candidatus Moeniiplasma glomeromycotorum]
MLLTGKKWLEPKKPEPPSEIAIPTENLPEQLPENLEPITKNKPVISVKEPGNKDNLLLPIQNTKNPPIANYQPKAEISEISPTSPVKFLSENQPSKQLPAEKEFLLEKIKELEEKLARIKSENANLKIENKHLKELIKQEAKIIQILPFKD